MLKVGYFGISGSTRESEGFMPWEHERPQS